jgi:hypothetical protein
LDGRLERVESRAETKSRSAKNLHLGPRPIRFGRHRTLPIDPDLVLKIEQNQNDINLCDQHGLLAQRVRTCPVWRWLSCRAQSSTPLLGLDEVWLERDDLRMNHYRALAYCLSMIFFGKPVSTKLVGVLGEENRGDRDDDDLAIERQRPHARIIGVAQYACLVGRATATGDLPKSRNPWPASRIGFYQRAIS